MTVGEALAQATQRLAPVSETPRLDAEILLAAGMGVGRAQLLSRLSSALPDGPFWQWVARREAFEPLAYILGEWEFFSLPIVCRQPILVPRPETEHLVEAVLAWVAAASREHVRILDLGTGTGCIALAIAANASNACVTAIDANPAAARLANENARRLELEGRVHVACADWFAGLSPGGNGFDVICSNPPYVEAETWAELPSTITRYEDPQALLAGSAGLDAIRHLFWAGRPYLAQGGLLAIEAGAGQAQAVEAEARHAGWILVRWRRDLAGHCRTAEFVLQR